MELKAYSRVLLKRWWIVLPAFLITLIATLMFTFAQAPVYRAIATFIVAPSGSFETVGSFVNGLEVLSRRTEIANTYTQVAGSSLILLLSLATYGGFRNALARLLPLDTGSAAHTASEINS